MNVLALDTATPSTVVAVLVEGSEAVELRDAPQAGSRGSHSELVMVLADAALAQAGIDWQDVELVAVGTGPGGYTGLRIGIATAQGLARGAGARLTGVCTLRALAEPLDGVRLALLDARRGELFAAAYKDDVEVIAPRVIPPSALAETIAEIGAARIRSIGDAACSQRAQLAELGVDVPADSSERHRVSAAAICRIALREPNAAVAPLYLRRPDAELALER